MSCRTSLQRDLSFGVVLEPDHDSPLSSGLSRGARRMSRSCPTLRFRLNAMNDLLGEVREGELQSLGVGG
jgi:hypothetical protein